MKKNSFKTLFVTALVLVSVGVCGQTTPQNKLSLSVWNGMVVAGYLDQGAFVNFGGPAVKWTSRQVSVLLGMLPSLRLKEDKSEGSRNAFVTPTLGAGLSLVYKHLVLQLPLYYAPKSASTDGKWKPGIGIGYKF